MESVVNKVDENVLTLADISTGNRCMIVKLHGHGGFRHRILEMGFIKGEIVEVIKNAPLQDPIEYKVMGTHISLRRSEATQIEVVSLEEDAHHDYLYNGTLTIQEHIAQEVAQRQKKIVVALVGNPNCGKTSFFNFTTGMHEKVGNYSGVTVDSKVGIFNHKGYEIHLTDLPGTYSLTEYTPEEIYVRDFLSNHHPDVVLNIVDAGNLERNLFLTTQLIDQNMRMVVALNMYDEFEKTGNILNYNKLSSMLYFPILPLVAKTGKGIENVLDNIIDVYENDLVKSKHIHINYGNDVEEAIKSLNELLKKNDNVGYLPHSRYLSLKLLENDSVINKEISNMSNYDEILKTASFYRQKIEKAYKDDITVVISDLKYGFIRGALNETLKVNNNQQRKSAYDLDKILTNKWLGFPILMIFIWLIFQGTFTIGAYPQQWLENGVAWLSHILRGIIPAGIWADMLIDGVIAGVGGVLIFLPNILILFVFISILEDTGYMARAAFIMDKIMHIFGLHGKSFIPYVIGFGCSVPAIMATRTLENHRDRILTVCTIPFMSCSARLPVYTLFVSAFFDSYQGLVLMSLYLVGILVAMLTSSLMSKTIFKKTFGHFVMELPPYRIPTLRNTLIHIWSRTSMYLKKMGTIILLASLIIWGLTYFPRHDKNTDNLTKQSYIEQIGHIVEPVIKPLGFDWKMGVSLLTGLAAKEIVVSSLGILYMNDEPIDEENLSLQKALQNVKTVDDKPITPLTAYSFLLFILLYFPCIATITAIWKEIGYKWMIFTIVYTIFLAWIVAFAVFQIGSLFL